MQEKVLAFSSFATDKLIKLLIILVPVFFVFAKGEHYYFSIYDIYKEVIIHSIAVLLLGCYLLKLFAEDEPRVKHSPLLWPIIFFYIAMLLSTLQAHNLHEAFIFIKRWTANFLITFVVYDHVSDKKLIRRYLNYLIFIGAAVSLYGILQHLKVEFSFLHQNFTGNSTFGNPNFASEFILVVFPLALLFVFADVQAGLFLYNLLAALIMFTFLFLNKSRAVWIGGGMGGMLILLYILIGFVRARIRFYVGKNEKRHALAIVRSVGVIGILIVLVIIASFTPLSEHNKYLGRIRSMPVQIRNEISTLLELELVKGKIRQGDTATQRLLIWWNTLKMVGQNSILGVGIGNFKIQYQPYRTKEEQMSTGPDIFVRRAHNEHVQLLSEVGLFGIIFFYWIIFGSIRMCIAIIKRSHDFFAQCLGIGFMLSVMSTYIAMFFNFTLQTPSPCMGLWLVTGLLMASYDVFLKQSSVSEIGTRIAQELHHGLRWGLIVIAVCLLVLPVYLVRPAQAYYHYQFGQAYEKMGLIENARDQLQQSIKYYYPSWEAHFVLANADAALGDLLTAKRRHMYSLSLNPYHQKGHYNLANTLYKIGEIDASIKHYKEAIRIDAVFHQAFNNLGSILYKEGRHAEALEYFQEVVALQPDYPSGLYNCAYILTLLKRTEEGWGYLKRAYQQSPNDAKVKALLGRYQQLGYKFD